MFKCEEISLYNFRVRIYFQIFFESTRKAFLYALIQRV